MNTFTVRCLGVRQDGRHIHVKFAQPGAGHFNLTFPETHQNEHDYTPGKDYQLSLSDLLSMKKPEPQGESIDMSPVGLEDIPQGLESDSDIVGDDNNPGPDTFTHVVTKETLDLNPDMAVQGIEVGDHIEVPLHEDQPLPDEIEADRQAALKSHEGNLGEAGLRELEARKDVPDTNVGDIAKAKKPAVKKKAPKTPKS